MNAREAMLGRVRQAVADGNRAGRVPPLPQRGEVGYQGAGLDSVARFCKELTIAGGCPHVARDNESAWQMIRAIVKDKGARKILIGEGGMIDRLELPGRLRRDGLEVTAVNALQERGSRETLFGADLGISNVEHLVAETGSVVVATSPDNPRSLSLLPPVHIAIAEQKQILPDLFDLFDLFSPIASSERLPPSCLTLITGPSKTGDIELKLVTGVHGPGEIHVIMCM